MKLIEIDEDSPYYYKLSKTQKQISNLLNDYDNHVEDIRGNYLEVCKTKINFKDDYNMKILQYPNYRNAVKLNLMEEKKMPYGKYKGKDIDDLPEDYVKKVLIRSKLYLTNSRFRKIIQKSKFGDLIKKLNAEKALSKSKSGGKKTKRRRTKRRTNRRTNRKKTYKGKTPFIKQDKSKKTLYYFYADYCGYCKRFDSMWETLEKKMNDKINFVKIDGVKDNNKKMLLEYDIQSFPTLIMKGSKKKFNDERTEDNIIHYLKNF